MRRRIGFITSSALPDLSSDDRCVLDALAVRGLDVVPWVWTTAAPPDLDAAVLRSCWDYHRAPDAFRAFLAGVSVPLFNTATIARWNMDKSYLRELASYGAILPKTAWVEAGDRRALATVLADAGLDDAVVKPRISLSAEDTFRVARRDADERETAYRAIVATRAVLVQAFVPAIATGEISLVYLGGRFSHAVRKTPADGDFRVQSDYGGARAREEAKPAWLAAADAVLARLPPMLYARVDLVEDGDALSWMELEAIDPELFFALVPEASARFADALRHAV